MYRESYFLTMTQRTMEASSYEEDELANLTCMESREFESFPEVEIDFVVKIVIYVICLQMENLDVSKIVAAQNHPIICIQTFKTEREGSMALDRLLEEVSPQYVAMYHCNVTAIRQLEVFETRKRRPVSQRMRVFFLVHAGTVEEQSYLTSLLREKKAFELLIDMKKV